ncbi:hypothetical protein M0802_013625 [Mischocyttarus mexicanus]|nr:hypothetical protein M0802_013625 [Mischocyttarus mexicanus]
MVNNEVNSTNLAAFKCELKNKRYFYMPLLRLNRRMSLNNVAKPAVATLHTPSLAGTRQHFNIGWSLEKTIQYLDSGRLGNIA